MKVEGSVECFKIHNNRYGRGYLKRKLNYLKWTYEVTVVSNVAKFHSLPNELHYLKTSTEAPDSDKYI